MVPIGPGTAQVKAYRKQKLSVRKSSNLISQQDSSLRALELEFIGVSAIGSSNQATFCTSRPGIKTLTLLFSLDDTLDLSEV